MKQDLDAFVSYASEDRHPIVSQIAGYLRQRGVRVWYDEDDLPPGERLSRMDNGIRRARFGLVFLSKAYPDKYWTMQELAGLRAREASGYLKVLPLLVDVDHDFVVSHFPTLAGTKHIQAGGRSDVEVAFDIIQIIRPDLAEYMHLREKIQRHIFSTSPRVGNPRRFSKGPVIHEHLSIHVHSRIRLIQASLEDVDESDIDEWLDNFSRDWHPHKELIWWEFFASLYLKIRHLASPPIPPKEIYDGLFPFVESRSRAGIDKWHGRLSQSKEAQVVHLLNEGGRIHREVFGDSMFQQVVAPDGDDR